MKIISLPIFLLILFLKNLKSWGNIFRESFGFQATLIVLVLVNIGVAAALFWSFQEEQKLKNELAAAENRLSQQRQFWNELSENVPGHQEIIDAQKTLTQFEIK
jgi:uncharacterized membrane protein